MLAKRLSQFIDFEGLSLRSFEINCGLTVGSLSRTISKNAAIGSNKLELILSAYPKLSSDWLLTGKGDMIKSLEDTHKTISEQLKKEADYHMKMNMILLDTIEKLKEKLGE